MVCVCRRKCAVGKLPCNALTFVWALAQKDCEALATTHLCRLFFHVNVWLHGPWRRHSFKRRQHHEDAMEARTRRPNKRAFWTLPFGTIWQSFFLCARLPEGGQKKIAKLKSNSIFQWSHNSVGYKVRSSRPSAGKFLASPHARDDVEPRPPWRTPLCNSLGNHLQQQKKHRELTVTQTVFEKCSHAKGVMGTIFLTIFRIVQDNIQTVFKTVIENLDIFRTVIKQYLNNIQSVFVLF